MWSAGAVTIAAVLTAVGAFRSDGVSMVYERGNGDAVVGLVVDRVGAILVLLTSVVGLVVQTFAARALDGDPNRSQFFVLAGVVSASTTLVALSVTGTGLVLGWVVTGAALTGLIGHHRHWAPAAAAMQQTRRAFAVGDLALLAALLLSIRFIGDIDLRDLGSETARLADERIVIGPWEPTSWLTVVAVLIVVAGICRSALVPAHRWLPGTVAAPTPVSALLHAGVVNGAGVLIIRLAPMVGSSTPAMGVAFAVGVVTAVLATAVMLVRADIKGSLAWSTAGQMGFMTVQLAVGAFAAALFHLVGHAMYKAALFLGAGNAISAHNVHRHLPTSTRRPQRLFRLAAATLVPGAAMVGAFLAFDPHLPTAAGFMLLAFGWLSAGRLVNGWLRAGAVTPGSIAAGLGLGAGWSVAYVGGVALFEHAVAGVLPVEVAGAVGTVWMVATMGVVALAVLVVSTLPGARGARLRRQTYVVLQGLGGAPLPKVSRCAEAPQRVRAAVFVPSKNRTAIERLDRVSIQ